MSMETTLPLLFPEAKPDPKPPTLTLLIVRPDLFLSYPIPTAGTLEIGRSDTAAIHVDDPSASRRHATLRTGSTITLEDHGAANGTQVRGQSIPPHLPVAVQVGEPFTIGSTTLMLQLHRQPLRARRVWPHIYFEGRLDDECHRGQRHHGSFALLRAKVPPGTALEQVVAAVDPGLTWGDALASYAPDDYEILISYRPGIDLAEIGDELIDRLNDAGMTTEHAFARFPEDGRTADALLGVLSEKLKAHGSGEATAGDALKSGAKTQALVLSSPAIKKVYSLAARAAASDISVMILGETGVGKDVLARYIAGQSPRAKASFLSLNCASFSDTLLESELFGHEKGAFTGAVQAKAGLLEAAPGGTVFLDEVGEMSAAMQARLLRVLESREVLRVGALKPRTIDVRFICATNRDLEQEVESGNFRRDLFYRLNGLSLFLPPLRERVDDVIPLAMRFAAEAAERSQRTPVPEFSPDALSVLRAYCWPGNIRELKNFVERAVVLCSGAVIAPEHLPLEKMRMGFAPPTATAASAPTDWAGLDELERINRALAETAGNQSRAADLLGMPRRTFLRRLEKYGVARPLKPR